MYVYQKYRFLILFSSKVKNRLQIPRTFRANVFKNYIGYSDHTLIKDHKSLKYENENNVFNIKACNLVHSSDTNMNSMTLNSCFAHMAEG